MIKFLRLTLQAYHHVRIRYSNRLLIKNWVWNYKLKAVGLLWSFTPIKVLFIKRLVSKEEFPRFIWLFLHLAKEYAILSWIQYHSKFKFQMVVCTKAALYRFFFFKANVIDSCLILLYTLIKVNKRTVFKLLFKCNFQAETNTAGIYLR